MFIGVSQIRMAQDGKPLPSPRVIRTTLFPDSNTTDPLFTHGLMAWGQIVAHDVALRSVQLGYNHQYYLHILYQ